MSDPITALSLVQGSTLYEKLKVQKKAACLTVSLCFVGLWKAVLYKSNSLRLCDDAVVPVINQASHHEGVWEHGGADPHILDCGKKRT
jgi:hypothetical protein